MSLILLIDLDNTLLENDMEVFIPAYLKSLGEHLANHISPERLIPALLDATQCMLQNNQPDRTLKQVFDAEFYEPLGLDQSAMEKPIAEFYARRFPALRSLTKQQPAALGLLQEAAERGYELVLATNPLFPRTAILQRLNWAGVSLETNPFQLIPSYETFHFAKPNPAFFAEILGQLGWPQKPVLMVGDDPYNDIIPAARIGLPTFWVSNHPPTKVAENFSPSGYGKLADLIDWLHRSEIADWAPEFTGIQAMLAILRSTPAVLLNIADSLLPTLWSESPESGSWSFTEILCHLRDVDADVNLLRIQKILHESNPFLPGINTDQWAVERQYYCQNGHQALRDFIGTRLELLYILDNLKPEDWLRSARHAIFGPTHIKELVNIIASHDRLHIRQAMEAREKVSTLTRL